MNVYHVNHLTSVASDYQRISWRWRGQVLYCVWEVPRMLLLGFTKRSIPKRDQHRKDIIQKELLFYRKYPHKNVMLLACL